ncbi:helix-turn-helix domain-containing protein [Granulicella aggregans]
MLAQRVEEAKNLLVNSDEPLVEVACCTGFSDQACFNRAFLTLMGISPG